MFLGRFSFVENEESINLSLSEELLYHAPFNPSLSKLGLIHPVAYEIPTYKNDQLTQIGNLRKAARLHVDIS